MTESSKRDPFDPEEPFDAMAESFRRQVVDLFLEAEGAAIFRDLPSARQLECFMAGVVTGLVGTCFACVVREGRDEIMAAIANYLPLARENAEDIQP